ncbi:uncharacterized protein LOC126907646 isoform X2 [Daktulosphaira vitifoliae]|nr:uncharacterized protein LOC126907646 isoform X2 [Daktulosphaira vitifoliae]
MVPIETFYDRHDLFKLLANFLCGERKYDNILKKKIIQSMKNNEDIKKLFESKELYDIYMSSSRIVNKIKPIDINDTKCPVCYVKSPYVIAKCRHPLCYECAESLRIRNQKSCPLCTMPFNIIASIQDGFVISNNGSVELLAAAYLLDVCIFVYINNKDWFLFRKDWPNYDKLDMKDEKCIYLYMNETQIGIVTMVVGT